MNLLYIHSEYTMNNVFLHVLFGVRTLLEIIIRDAKQTAIPKMNQWRETDCATIETKR